MKDEWHLAVRNLRRNRRRNLATGLMVALGFAGLSLLGGYVTRADAYLRTSAVYVQHGGHVVIYHEDGLDKAMARPSRYSLTPVHQAAIRSAAAADPRVAFVAAYLRGMGLAGNGCRSVPFVALGIEPAAQRRVLTDPDVTTFNADTARPVRGRQLFEYAALDDRIGLAAGLAALLGKTRVRDDFSGPIPVAALPDCSAPGAAAASSADPYVQIAALTYDGSIAALDAEVVNLFHAASTVEEDQVLQAPLSMLQRLYDTDAVSYMAVYLRDWRDTGRVANDLRASLRAARVPVDVYEFTDERVSPFYAGSMAFIRSMAGFIVLIVASVVVLGVMNSTTLTVYERSREFGTLRAVGYTRRQVIGLVVREVALVSLLGIVVGLVLAHAAAAAVVLLDVRVSPPDVPGTMQVVLTPDIRTSLSLTALLVPLSLLVAWTVVRRRLRERTSDLLIAINA